MMARRKYVDCIANHIADCIFLIKGGSYYDDEFIEFTTGN